MASVLQRTETNPVQAKKQQTSIIIFTEFNLRHGIDDIIIVAVVHMVVVVLDSSTIKLREDFFRSEGII